jgi:hypothetical protein
VSRELRDAYMDEIIFSLSVIITLICYQQGLKFLTWLFGFKSAFDFYCANKAAYRFVKKEEVSNVNNY